MTELKIKGRSGFAVGIEKSVKETERLVVGRTKQADVAVDDPLLSARHFEILFVRDAFDLVDLESMNGTFVNGNKTTRCKLIDGDLIRAGKSEFEVSVTGPATAARGSDTAVMTTGNQAAADPSRQIRRESPIPSPHPSANPSKSGFRETPAADVVTHFRIQALFVDAADVSADVQPDVFISELKQRHFTKEAVQFLAYALPKRDAVWWTCLCVRHANPELNETKRQVLDLVERWVREPNDDLRHEIMAQASKSDMQSSSDWAGVSAFWSGGSIAPKGSPAVEAADDLAGKAVSGAVLIASTEQTPRQVESLREAFIDLGLEIAKGQHLWKE
ncbi:MAG: FHA domain-containing protein [Planctomycetaceae bacterium]